MFCMEIQKIPLDNMGLSETIKAMELYNKKGFKTNIYSGQGKTWLSVSK